MSGKSRQVFIRIMIEDIYNDVFPADPWLEKLHKIYCRKIYSNNIKLFIPVGCSMIIGAPVMGARMTVFKCKI